MQDEARQGNRLKIHGWRLRGLLVPRLAMLELPSNLLRDLVVVMDLDYFKQRLLLLRADVLLVPLDEGEEGLVPEYGKFSLLASEVEEMEDTGVYHSVRQGILLIKENSQK